MHSYSADFFQLISVYCLILIAPGLDFAVVLRESLLYGRVRGVAAALGVSCAVAIHCTYTILGLGLIITQSLLLFTLIKWAGIAYLLYIGVKALFAKPNSAALARTAAVSAAAARTGKKAFLAGFTCNLLNPKCILFFLSVFSSLIAAAAPIGLKALYGVVMVCCCCAWFSCVAFFLTMPKVSRIYRKLGQLIDRVTGAVFILLGISLMFQKAQN